MPYNIRYPMIAGASEKDQLTQMKSYLHQLVEELNYSLNNIDTVQIQYIKPPTKSESSKKEDEKGTQATFDALKPLIIKSAEIVEAYYEEINERLEGIYVAQSDFGTFVEQTAQEITKNSTDITQVFTNVQTIATEVNTIGSDVQNIDSKVKNIDSSVKTIDTTVKTVETTVQTMDSNVKNIETTIVTISNEVSNVDTELQGVKTGVQAVEQKAQTIESEVQTIDSNVQSIGTNVQAIETNLQDTKVGIGSNLESLSEEVGQLDSDLRGVKEGVETNLQGLTNEVGAIDSKLEDAKSAINSDLETLKNEIADIVYSIIEVNAHIKSGLLYYDDNEIPIYGLEIGQINTIDGVEVFNKYARFTAGRLSFYDKNDIEIAYISDYKLYITNAEITNTLKLGAFLIDTSKGFRLKYVGRR